MTWNLTSYFNGDNACAVNPDTLSPLDLAFVGDAVFGLLVREELALQGKRPVKDLHSMSVKRVKAQAQAKAARAVASMLSDEETEVYKRGRNAHVGSVPKNASVGEYHAATGLEALFGWLHLKGRADRVRELYAFISKEASEDET